MSRCAQCGHEQAEGRFCSQCGSPLGPPTPAAEPAPGAGPAPDPERDPTVTHVRGFPPVPSVAPGPTAPPPAAPPPPPGPTGPPPATPPPTSGARYPLYADEVAPDAPHASPTPSAPPSAPPPPPPEPEPELTSLTDGLLHTGPLTLTADPHERRGRTWVVWLLGLLVFLLVLALGLWLLLGGSDDTASGQDQPSAPAEAAPATSSAAAPTPSPTASPTASASPSLAPRGGRPHDLTGDATARAPRTATPGTDVRGRPITFDAANMLDGEPTTAWRMDGDGTGTVLTFALGSPATVTEVGLVNGYAKSARAGRRTLDWYSGNRKVTRVEWLFDDGTRVTQRLARTRSLQTVEVPEATTRRVRLRITGVSAPGNGPAARDFTPISEVALTGRTG